MKRILLLAIIVSSCAVNDATNTDEDCELVMNDFRFAVQEVEENYPGYCLLNNKQKKEYSFMRDSLDKLVSSCLLPEYDAIGKYLSWFHDPHLRTCWDAHAYLQKQSIDYESYFDYSPMKVSRKVSDETYLIRFPSCDGDDPDMQWIIQSVKDYKKSDCKFLIIDIRGNGGGSDSFFKPYLELLYDTPCKVAGADFFYTKKNLKQMKEYFPLKMFFLSLLHRREPERVNWPFVKSLSIRYMKKGTYPLAAALIIDNNVGSSAEEMVIEIQAASSRTRIYGKDNTFGCLDFSNCRPVSLPVCGQYFLIPMTISHRWPEQSVDKEGLPPDICIPIQYPTILHDNIDEWVLWVSNDLETKSKALRNEP